MHKLRTLTFDNLLSTDSKEYLQFVSMGGLRKLLHNTLKLNKNIFTRTSEHSTTTKTLTFPHAPLFSPTYSDRFSKLFSE